MCGTGIHIFSFIFLTPRQIYNTLDFQAEKEKSGFVPSKRKNNVTKHVQFDTQPGTSDITAAAAATGNSDDALLAAMFEET